MLYTRVATTEEIPAGERKRFDIEGQRITVFNIDNTYHAILDTCPHKRTAPLLRGTLDGEAIQCPNHGYRFNLRTGFCDKGERWNTRIFPVKVENGAILIGFEDLD